VPAARPRTDAAAKAVPSIDRRDFRFSQNAVSARGQVADRECPHADSPERHGPVGSPALQEPPPVDRIADRRRTSSLEAAAKIAAPVLDGLQLAPSLTDHRLSESAYGRVAERVGTERRPPSRT